MSAYEDAWKSVDAAADRLGTTHLRDLFADDAKRCESFSVEACGVLADFSKEKLDERALNALFGLAGAADLPGKIAELFNGAPLNLTEERSALHMALRDGVADGTRSAGVEVLPQVQVERDRMLAFAEDVRCGRISASDGQPFSHVINIGIGGSDLGAAMAVRALAPWHDGPGVHFVANVDGTALADTVRDLDPARTLIVIASKSFGTLETMINARSARTWLQDSLGDAVGQHMAAVSTNLDAVSEFGITPERVFGFWDWVGGRYSVWSSVGLPLAIAIGEEAFRAFLNGARAMDQHFCEAPLEQNLPVLLGLIGIWRRNAMGCPVCAIVPYEERLARLPAFLQQLEMESNGKRVRTSGEPVERATAGVTFGEPGTNTQHSFFQLLHQGTDIVPVDFLLSLRPTDGMDGHHDALFASALAQASALAFGRTAAEVRAEMLQRQADPAKIEALLPHRTFPGDRPSTILMYETLTPSLLGTLIALFEHRTFVQGVLWGINSFDQWGVELGKELGQSVQECLQEGPLDGFDGSTAALIQRYRDQL